MRVRPRFKEKQEKITGVIMKGKNWKKKALSKAIAGVFACGVLSGNVVAAPQAGTVQIEIGGVFLDLVIWTLEAGILGGIVRLHLKETRQAFQLPGLSKQVKHLQTLR